MRKGGSCHRVIGQNIRWKNRLPEEIKLSYISVSSYRSCFSDQSSTAVASTLRPAMLYCTCEIILWKVVVRARCEQVLRPHWALSV